jgi:hypothetical protein
MGDLKKIPEFENAKAEARFWDEHDSAEYVDWSKADKVVFPNLKSSTESISLRLPSPFVGTDQRASEWERCAAIPITHESLSKRSS